MKWKFWRKESALAHLDPHTLAYVMVQKMVERGFPFNKWRADEDVMPERAVAWVEMCVNIYQLTIFLDFLERKFGSDVAGIVRSHVIALMNKGPMGAAIGSLFGAVQVGRSTLEREQFFADNPAIQVDCNVAKAFLSLAAESDADKDALYPLLGKSLTLGRVSAEAGFASLVESIEFRPETIVGLQRHER